MDKNAQIKIELIDNDDKCFLKINEISIEDITEKYEIVKKGGEDAKLIITIPLSNVEIKANNESYLLK